MPHPRKVVFIMTDTQRWDMVSCYRDTGLHTPNIDALAARGMRFERAYTTQPVCQPARAGLFTGQYPHSVAGWSNCMGISDNVHTLGERLADRGVHTAYVGKWHLDGGDYFGLGRCPKGWDAAYWYDMRNYLDELTPKERTASRSAASMAAHDFPSEFTFGHRVADRAVRFLENHADEDFFLSVSFDEPHDPYLCPPPYSTMYDGYAFPASPNVGDALDSKPDYQRIWAGGALREDRTDYSIEHPYYFGCNAFVDTQIGRVLDAVYALAPDALIIYTSDHGDFLGSHRLSGKGPAVYDEIARIPFIAAGPGIEAGTVNRNPISHIGVAPTVMEWMGFAPPEIFEGGSLMPALMNPMERADDCVFIEFGRYEVDHDGFGGFQPLRAAFNGRYKLSVNLLSADELYDLEADPNEMVNLIDDPAHAAARDRLHERLLRHMNETRDPFRGYQWRNRPWRTDAPAPTWAVDGMTRQRVEEERYERRQLDYADGLPIAEAVRKK